MKQIILNFTSKKPKQRKIKNKDALISKMQDFSVIEDDEVKILADIIQKNQSKISDMVIFILGNENFNTSKIRYKKHLQQSSEDELLELCDTIVSEKDKEIEFLKLENERLKQENNRLKCKVESMSFVHSIKEATQPKKAEIIIGKDVQELYQGEFIDIILRALNNEINTTCIQEKTSRRKDILQSIILNNKTNQSEQEIADLFYNSLEDDGSISIKNFTVLEQYGFKVEKAGSGHYKIKLKDSDKYIVTVGSTISDYRAKENLFSKFKKIFLG